MAVRLGNCVSMTAREGALIVSIDDAGIRVRMIAAEPAQQGGAKIETNLRVIVNGAIDPGIDDVGAGIWLITLGVDSFIPVMKRRGAGFDFDDACPGVFAWWLVEVSVNN